MQFNIGDKVSFKNDKLDGIVIKIISDKSVKVSLEDGFDIDADVSQLVKTGEASKAFESFFKRKEKAQEQLQFQDQAKLDKETFLNRFGNPGQILLITLPSELQQIQSGAVLFRIENNTDYMLFTVTTFNTDNGAEQLMAGEIKPHSILESVFYKRHEISAWKNLHVDLIFSRNEKFQLIKPLSKDISIQLPDWKIVNDLFKGINAFVRSQTILEISEQLLDVEKLKQTFEHKEAKQFLKKNTTTNIFSLELEVDLHIEEITEHYKHLSNSEILEIQLTHFRAMMHDAIFKKAYKITFIHGVGEGVLKNAILDELKHYKGIRIKPAPTERYGQGATDVVFE